MQEELIEKRKQRIKEFFKSVLSQKSMICFVGLLFVLLLGTYIRIQNLPLLEGKYTIELDTEYFLRMAGRRVGLNNF